MGRLANLFDRFRRTANVPPAPLAGRPPPPRPPARVSGKEVLQISYAPTRDGDADPGEVVWGWVPYEDDPSQGKDRPVLVIGTIADDYAGLPLTSKDHTDRPDCVALGTGPWDREGRPSYVKLDRVLRFDPGDIRREGGTLDKGRFDDVVGSLQSYYASGAP